MIKDIKREDYCITQHIPLYIMIKVLIISFDYFLGSFDNLGSVKNIYSQTYSPFLNELIEMWILHIQGVKNLNIKGVNLNIKELEKSIFASIPDAIILSLNGIICKV